MPSGPTPVYFMLWNAGFCNQLASFELAVGINALLRRPICVAMQFAKRSLAREVPNTLLTRFPFLSCNQNSVISDYVQCLAPSVYVVTEQLLHQRVPQAYPIDLSGICLINEAFDDSDHYRHQFTDGRICLWVSDLLQKSSPLFFFNTLSWYSRFFLGRTHELNAALSGVTSKEEYKDLAATIAHDLGRFIGAHIRGTDLSRFFQIQAGPILRDFEEAFRSDLPLVVASDDWESPVLRAVLRQTNRSIINLEELILTEYQRGFRALPIHDYVTLGWISNLVLGYSQDFIGTPGSTFTGYIHRQLARKGSGTWRFLSAAKGEMVLSAQPSWFHSPIPSHQRNWWREWPECTDQLFGT